MKHRHFLTAAATCIAVFAFATPAHAHNAAVNATCDTLNVDLTFYFGGPTNNRVTVTIDGTVVDDELFSGSFEALYAWLDTVSHTWAVVVDANLNTGSPTEFDESSSGVQEPCTTTTTTSVTTTTATPAPSTSTTLGPPDPTTTTGAPTSTVTSTPGSSTSAPPPVAPTSTLPPPERGTSVPQTPPDGYCWNTDNDPPSMNYEPCVGVPIDGDDPYEFGRIDLTDEPVDRLPATGSSDWLWPFGVIAVCLVGTGMLLARRPS